MVYHIGGLYWVAFFGGLFWTSYFVSIYFIRHWFKHVTIYALQPLEKVVPNRIPHWNRFIGLAFYGRLFWTSLFVSSTFFTKLWKVDTKCYHICCQHLHTVYCIPHWNRFIGSPFMAGYFRLPNFVSIYCIQKWYHICGQEMNDILNKWPAIKYP
jgi:hypothetical protein